MSGFLVWEGRFDYEPTTQYRVVENVGATRMSERWILEEMEGRDALNVAKWGRREWSSRSLSHFMNLYLEDLSQRVLAKFREMAADEHKGDGGCVGEV